MNRQKTAQVSNTGPALVTSQMVKEERMSWILERLTREGKVLANDLTTELGVSEDTIRRDLRELAAMRRLRRVHGGALPPGRSALDFEARLQQSVPEKKSIALAAVRLIEKDSIVFLDGGTTNVHVAESLPHDLTATVITNSVPVASVLSDHPGVEVFLVGGRVLKSSRVTLGPEAVDAIRGFRAGLFLMGTCSLDIAAGLTVPHIEEASIKRAMVASSARVVALVTAEKIGTATTCIVSTIDDLDAFITERSTEPAVIAPFRNAGVEIIFGEETA